MELHAGWFTNTQRGQLPDSEGAGEWTGGMPFVGWLLARVVFRRSPVMSFFCEIRSSTNAVLKRDGGFADVEAAKSAARADAKKMKDSL